LDQYVEPSVIRTKTPDAPREKREDGARQTTVDRDVTTATVSPARPNWQNSVRVEALVEDAHGNRSDTVTVTEVPPDVGPLSGNTATTVGTDTFKWLFSMMSSVVSSEEPNAGLQSVSLPSWSKMTTESPPSNVGFRVYVRVDIAVFTWDSVPVNTTVLSMEPFPRKPLPNPQDTFRYVTGAEACRLMDAEGFAAAMVTRMTPPVPALFWTVNPGMDRRWTVARVRVGASFTGTTEMGTVAVSVRG